MADEWAVFDSAIVRCSTAKEFLQELLDRMVGAEEEDFAEIVRDMQKTSSAVRLMMTQLGADADEIESLVINTVAGG